MVTKLPTRIKKKAKRKRNENKKVKEQAEAKLSRKEQRHLRRALDATIKQKANGVINEQAMILVGGVRKYRTLFWLSSVINVALVALVIWLGVR